eukprot:scaffold1220_cov259-Pinguiococcus_pyrenoidosus.AAC.45
MGTTWPSWCPVEHRIARQAASRKTEECRNQALWYLLSIFVLGCASSYLRHFCRPTRLCDSQITGAAGDTQRMCCLQEPKKSYKSRKRATRADKELTCVHGCAWRSLVSGKTRRQDFACDLDRASRSASQHLAPAHRRLPPAHPRHAPRPQLRGRPHTDLLARRSPPVSDHATPCRPTAFRISADTRCTRRRISAVPLPASAPRCHRTAAADCAPSKGPSRCDTSCEGPRRTARGPSGTAGPADRPRCRP